MTRRRGVLLSVLGLVQRGWRAAALLGVASAGLLFSPAPARAAAALRVRVTVTSLEGAPRCPGPPELLAALARALPTSDLIIGSADPGSEVVVRDLGAEYVVQVAGQRRRFSNPLRSCEERARVAAVFASLALHPPELASVAFQTAAPPRPAGPMALLETVGLLGVAAGAVEPSLTAGGAVRIYVGWSLIGASLGVHGLAPQTQRLAAGTARAWLLPVDVSVRLRWRGARFEVAGEAGVLLALLQLAASPEPGVPAAAAFTPAEPVWRFDGGLRLAVDLRRWVSARVAPMLGVEAWLWPRPYQLVLEPQGVVAERPSLMIVGRVGLAIQLR